MVAWSFPFEPDFRKYDTVIGIIGKTQGVSMAINPPANASQKNSHNDEAVFSAGI